MDQKLILVDLANTLAHALEIEISKKYWVSFPGFANQC